MNIKNGGKDLAMMRKNHQNPEEKMIVFSI
jgi:hypothetical protein